MTSVTEGGTGEPRRRMAAPERREAILAAARDAFAEGSYHEISLDRVAEGAGISKALIYEHFPSKRDLHRALLESYFGDLLERVVGAIAEAAPGEGRQRAGLDAFLAFVEERRGGWRICWERFCRWSGRFFYTRCFGIYTRMIWSRAGRSSGR